MKEMTLTTRIAALIIMPALLVGAAFPTSAQAAGDKVAGWIPYWAASAGFKDAKKHFDELDTVYLFAYIAKQDGTVKDEMGLSKSAAKRFIKDAKAAGVEVVPTVMWSDGNAIHAVLSDAAKRKKHVENIVQMVRDGGFSGVDVDYEGKKADTKEYFSAFLRELDAALGSKTLVCSIEARTPADSLYTVVPTTLRYANDLAVIGSVCDVVNVMTYDQQRADLKLNKARQGLPYYPVADPEWVTKVVKLMDDDIPASKIMLGTATYGRELEITVAPDWFRGYDQLWSVNPGYAEKEAKKAKVKPSRNAAGELSFSYVPKKSKVKLSGVSAPSGTPSGMEVAAKALAYANKTGEEVKFNLVWWSDAQAIGDKAKLAKSLGLRGISIFKIDGGEDGGLWSRI